MLVLSTSSTLEQNPDCFCTLSLFSMRIAANLECTPSTLPVLFQYTVQHTFESHLSILSSSYRTPSNNESSYITHRGSIFTSISQEVSALQNFTTHPSVPHNFHSLPPSSGEAYSQGFHLSAAHYLRHFSFLLLCSHYFRLNLGLLGCASDEFGSSDDGEC